MMLILFIIVCAVLIYGVPKLFKIKGEREALKPEFYSVKLLGGPFDGDAQNIPKEKDDSGEWTNAPHFFITPYPPKMDDEGHPPQENIVGWMRGTLYIRPNYAYYQQVTPEEYFYVRDIDEEEIARIQHTGKLPEVIKQDED